MQDYEGLKPGTTVMEVLESKDQKQDGIEDDAVKQALIEGNTPTLTKLDKHLVKTYRIVQEILGKIDEN